MDFGKDYGPKDFLNNMQEMINDANKARYVSVRVLGVATKQIRLLKKREDADSCPADVIDEVNIYEKPRQKIIKTENIESIEEFEHDGKKGSLIELYHKPSLFVSENLIELALSANIKFEA